MFVVPFEFVSSGTLVEFERLLFMILLSDGPHVCNPVLVYINSGVGVISPYVLLALFSESLSCCLLPLNTCLISLNSTVEVNVCSTVNPELYAERKSYH